MRSHSGEDKSYLELTDSRRNSHYWGTKYAILKQWLKEGTVVRVGNRDKLGEAWVKKNVRCILPFVIEAGKPRLCVDGSSMSTVGPKEKPECILDTLKDALSMLQPGMLLCKSDDRLEIIYLFL